MYWSRRKQANYLEGGKSTRIRKDTETHTFVHTNGNVTPEIIYERSIRKKENDKNNVIQSIVRQ